jgi:hypothetical protein
MRRILWIAVGAAVIAALFAVPVLGGQSIGQKLQSIVSREKKLEKRVNALAKRPLPRGRQGPAGPAGATGPKGETGAKGTAGSTGTIDSVQGFVASGSVGTASSPVTSVALPRVSNYLIEANAVFVNTGGAAVTVTCDLLFGPTADLLDTASVRLGASGGLDTETLGLSSLLDATATGSVRMDCEATATGVTFSDADLVIFG